MSPLPTIALLRRDLTRRGRPSVARCFLSGGCRFLTWWFWTIVPAMFLARRAWPGEWGLQMSATLGWLLMGFVGSGILSAFRWRVDPLHIAKSFDRQHATDDRVLSALEVTSSEREKPLHILLMRQAAGLLNHHRAAATSPPPLCFPSLRQILLSMLLVAVIWLAPSIGQGGIGEPGGAGEHDVSAAGGSPKTGAGSATDSASGDGAPSDSSWVDTTVFSATTDKGTYLLGEEIHLSLRLRTESEGGRSEPLVVVLTADGEHQIELPVEWELPNGANETLVDDFDLKERLEANECYRPGLLDLDVEVRSAATPNIGLRSPTVTIRISENVTNDKVVSPQPVKPDTSTEPKPNPNPEQPKQEKEEPNKPDGQNDPNNDTGPEPPPVGDIESNPVVVEPLFSGDERRRRDVRVYNREKEEGDNPKEKLPAKPPAIEPGAPAPIQPSRKTRLAGSERELVRRYFERLRNRRSTTGGDKR